MRNCLDQQRAAFLQAPYPSIVQRKKRLLALKRCLLDNQQAICQAISDDFGYRNHNETLFLELMTSVGDIDFSLAKLKGWMNPERRGVALQFMPASNRIMYQPLGVIGIIVPWNYPLYLAIGPLIAALAAGNRAMLKMSEFTPKFNQLLTSILAEHFEQTQVAVIQGEADVAAEFSRLPFDHLMFTGSTSVGVHVMKAAAENLTPVTLELGGKSPVFVDDKISLDTVAQRILFGKCVNGGQTCVAPDYVLCPKDKVEPLAQALMTLYNQFYPDFAQNQDLTHVVNDRQYQRLLNWLDEAKTAGTRILSPTSKDFDHYRDQRKMPLQLALNPADQLQLMQQEIFGPILPIVGYDDLDSAISYVQARPRPLALYIISFDKAWQQQILDRTHSGGVTINDTVVHFGQKDLPVGGVGPSGMGHYHGREGFNTFSKAKAIHAKGLINSIAFIHPPYHKSLLKWVLKVFMR